MLNKSIAKKLVWVGLTHTHTHFFWINTSQKMREIINQSIDEIASQYNVDEQFVRHYVYVSLIVIFALVCGVVFKKLIVPLIKRIILKTSFKFDDYLFSDSTFKTFSHLIPAFIIVVLLPICYIGKETTSLIYIVFYRAINIYIIILVAHIGIK